MIPVPCIQTIAQPGTASGAISNAVIDEATSTPIIDDADSTVITDEGA